VPQAQAIHRVDHIAVEQLAIAIAREVKNFVHRRPISPTTGHEALTALAHVAASMIARNSTDKTTDLNNFFLDCLDEAVQEFREDS